MGPSRLVQVCPTYLHTGQFHLSWNTSHLHNFVATQAGTRDKWRDAPNTCWKHKPTWLVLSSAAVSTGFIQNSDTGNSRLVLVVLAHLHIWPVWCSNSGIVWRHEGWKRKLKMVLKLHRADCWTMTQFRGPRLCYTEEKHCDKNNMRCCVTEQGVRHSLVGSVLMKTSRPSTRSKMDQTCRGSWNCRCWLHPWLLHTWSTHLAWSTELLSLDWISRRHILFRTDLFYLHDGGRDAHLVSGLETCNNTHYNYEYYCDQCHLGQSHGVRYYRYDTGYATLTKEVLWNWWSTGMGLRPGDAFHTCGHLADNFGDSARVLQDSCPTILGFYAPFLLP